MHGDEEMNSCTDREEVYERRTVRDVKFDGRGKG
jgi:hypothetical protein